MPRALLIGMLSLCVALPALSDESAPNPSSSEVEKWVREAVERAAPEIRVSMMHTEDWSRYVSNFHFVAPRFDGIEDGTTITFAKGDKGPFPIAEIDETGRLLVWWELCSLNGLKTEDCRREVNAVVAHEVRHFRQWQALAGAVLRSVEGKERAVPPRSLATLAEVPGAVVLFLKIWADGPHYQCREVEAHLADIEEKIAAAGALTMLRMYAAGCAKSKWSGGFDTVLRKARALTAGAP